MMRKVAITIKTTMREAEEVQSESLDSAGHAGSGAIGFNGNGNISG